MFRDSGRGDFPESIRILVFAMDFMDTTALETCTDLVSQRPVRHDVASSLFTLLLSINELYNEDVHPLGAQIVTHLQERRMQNLLNVKRVSRDNGCDNDTRATTSADADSVGARKRTSSFKRVERRVCNAHLPYLFWNGSNKTTKGCITVRLITTDVDALADACTRFAQAATPSAAFEGLCVLTPENLSRVAVEAYFRCDTRTATNNAAMFILENVSALDVVSSVVFFSECKLLAARYYKTHPFAVLSNVLKFYACTFANSITFEDVSSQDLLKFFIHSLFLLQKGFKTYNPDDPFFASFAGVSGQNVANTMYKATQTTHADSDTASDMQYAVRCVRNNRELLMSGNGIAVGGRTVCELIGATLPASDPHIYHNA